MILNPAPVRALPARAWQHIAYLTPNSQEASALAALEQEPRVADALLEKGPRAVITTLGAEGALLTTARARMAMRISNGMSSACGLVFCSVWP